jgi:ankyrin repeat protein
MGRTPLMWAVRRGDLGLVEMLLKTGRIDLEAEDDYGVTVSAWLNPHRRKSIMKALDEAAAARAGERVL